MDLRNNLHAVLALAALFYHGSALYVRVFGTLILHHHGLP